MNRFIQMRTHAVATIAAVTTCAIAVLLLPSASAVPSASNRAAEQQSQATTATAAPGTIASKVRGTFPGGLVRGTFEPRRFFVKHGDAYAFGTLTVQLTRTTGEVIGSVSKKVTLPVKKASNPSRPAARATCDILHLVLGPLDLDLLGLQIHLNWVVLDIVAVTGAGNLLGNLFCAVTGLLDGTGLLGQLRLANILNRILSILRL